LNHPLPMNYSKTKKQSADQAREMVPKPVVNVHGLKRWTGRSVGNLEAVLFESGNDLIDDSFDRQMRRIDDVRILRDDER
jgi:hypothetical protein